MFYNIVSSYYGIEKRRNIIVVIGIGAYSSKQKLERAHSLGYI
jgi:hypothetical protein